MIVIIGILALWFPFRMLNAEIFSSISGIVTAEDTGKGVLNVDVDALGVGGGATGQVHAVTDQNGQYVLKNLRPGTYVIGFKKKGTQYIIEEPNVPIDLPRGKNIVNANYSLKLGTSLSGRVYDSDGISPLGNMRVTVEIDKPQPAGARNLLTTRTDSEGNYTIYGLPATDMCTVSVDITGHSSLTKTMQIRKGQPIEYINFIAKWDVTTGITGVIKSARDNRPLAAALVTLWDNADNEVANARSDESGGYTITGISPGTYKATAFWPGGGGWLTKASIIIELNKLTTVNFEIDQNKQLSISTLFD